MAANTEKGHVICSVGVADLVKTKSGVQYRIDGLWVQSGEVFMAYLLMLVTRAMTGEGLTQINKPIEQSPRPAPIVQPAAQPVTIPAVVDAPRVATPTDGETRPTAVESGDDV